MISIGAKKELLGEFKNGGSDYSPQGRELGKLVPYGIYDIGANDGYVSHGIDHDTGQFAVNSVRLWLDHRRSLQQLADETNLTIQVCHYPPGTSKWNKIEHRMFCFITQNWRVMPLVSLYVAIALKAHPTTKKAFRRWRRSMLDAEVGRSKPKPIEGSDGSSTAPSVATQPLSFSLLDRCGNPAESGIKLVDTLADGRANSRSIYAAPPISDGLISHAAGMASEEASGDDDGV